MIKNLKYNFLKSLNKNEKYENLNKFIQGLNFNFAHRHCIIMYGWINSGFKNE